MATVSKKHARSMMAAMLLALPALSHSAPITYQYTGNNFDSGVTAPFTTSDFVSAVVTFDDAALADNIVTYEEISFLSLDTGAHFFSTELYPTPHSDGIHMSSFISFTGDAVNEWSLRIDAANVGNVRTVSHGTLVVDDTYLIGGGNASVVNAGIWGLAAASEAPAPGSLALMGLGLVGLAMRKTAKR